MFVTGILLFFGVHLVPLHSKLKQSIESKIGENVYKTFFSIISLIGLLLIILGYESSADSLYQINTKVYFYSKFFMFLSLTILISAYFPTYIKKYTKHPMSVGIAIWALMHLLTNSDTSSVILFGSFIIYGIVSVLVAELKGIDKKTLTPRIVFDALSMALGVFLTFLAFNFHEYLSGVKLF